MRLYLLPVSTRRALLYAQRLNDTTTPHERSTIDKGAAWAARKWSQWEKMDTGWQRTVVGYGNYAFRRIPFEEWGLKSVPPLSARRRQEQLAALEKGEKGEKLEDDGLKMDGGRVELVFPPAAIPGEQAEAVVGRLATERQALHRKRMMWCFVGMPIVAPFALVPVIPNLPFFYLAYRAWSHWRALHGGQHVQFLIQNKLLDVCPSPALDRLYVRKPGATTSSNNEKDNGDGDGDGERMLITREQVADFSAILDLPPVETELERAIWQVEQSIKRERQRRGDET